MALLMKCAQGPRLIRIHQHEGIEGAAYRFNILEAGGDRFIKVINFCWSVSYWTSPVLLTILYRRGYFSTEGLISILKFIIAVGVVYFGAFCARGIGRFTNQDYISFISVLTDAQKAYTFPNKRALMKYDFEFWAWPADFRMADLNTGDSKKVKQQVSRSSKYETSLKTLPCSIISYIFAHTIGRRMVYPGGTSLMNAIVGDSLGQARAKLVEEKDGLRSKVVTEDNNAIDTMFLDRRGKIDDNGSTLVICCEGNAGFYEIGCCSTPMDLGYSVLGWNHPGFGGSSGEAFPDQEQNAVDAVMQYAINRLGFQPENIVLFAWSIGGYTASWAAMNYPDIKYMILDATFDDIIPLAISKMPNALKGIVVLTLRTYLNLNIAEHVTRYDGPLLLIRRSKDEIITTESAPGVPPAVHSNRGNFLLKKVLQHRYPHIADSSTMSVLEQWLEREPPQQRKLLDQYNVDADFCLAALKSYSEQDSPRFPMLIGDDWSQVEKNKMILYLASRYMEDFDSTHCTPLPPQFFKKPWNLTMDGSQ
ncbi:phosphatidylserine lipase ABHD16A-like [Gigantopelta aegis]|uniref:phosphatidylserine lipase ABHD16A-like n=1 Tax=Gigantopelta aegis TaxID=1735272 RepID=UPI001B88B262|nr:phosphatidylserine lipase ABHD16A-like [Gigantopelta aegis]